MTFGRRVRWIGLSITLLLLICVQVSHAATIWSQDFSFDDGNWNFSPGSPSSSITISGGTLNLVSACCDFAGPFAGRDLGTAGTSLTHYWRVSTRFQYTNLTGYGTNAIGVGSAAFTGRALNPGYADILGVHQEQQLPWAPTTGLNLYVFGTRQITLPNSQNEWWNLVLNVTPGTWAVQFSNEQTHASYSFSGTTPTNNAVPHNVILGDPTTQAFGGAWTGLQNDAIVFEADLEAPVSHVNLTGPSTVAGWYTGPVQVAESATDTWSGVASLKYILDGALSTAYSSPFTISGEGVHTVDHQATDKAGNVETITTTSFGIDTVPPITTAQVSGPQTNTWYTANPSLVLNAVDATSGVASTAYQIDGNAPHIYGGTVPLNGDGTHVIRYASVDNAGNLESAQQTTVQIDTTSPVTAAGYTGPVGTNGWYTGAVTAALSATDGTSGVAQIKAALDGSLLALYVNPIIIGGRVFIT